jgi:mono/diheme cytochrome c family protein
MSLALLITFCLLCTFVPRPASAAQQSSHPSGEAQAKPGPPMSGADIFKWYCAACHGKTGKGDGPAASVFKVRPPDLTLLSKRNKGKFPAAYVTRVLRNGPKPSAHGTAEMPTWGPLFAELNAKGRTTVDIQAVVHYLEGMQQK